MKNIIFFFLFSFHLSLSQAQMTFQKTFGVESGTDGNVVQQTKDGGYIICSETISFGAGNSDAYLIKTDSAGILQWSKTFGGTNVEEGMYVQQTKDGGFIMTGITYSFGGGDCDVYLVKTASDGSLQWSKTFGGTKDDEGWGGSANN